MFRFELDCVVSCLQNVTGTRMSVPDMRGGSSEQHRYDNEQVRICLLLLAWDNTFGS